MWCCIFLLLPLCFAPSAALQPAVLRSRGAEDPDRLANASVEYGYVEYPSRAPVHAPQALPWGMEIWSGDTVWYSMRRKHPVGVVANVHNGLVVWADVGYVSYQSILLISCVCYPALFVLLITLMAMCVNICMFVKPEQTAASSGLSAAGSSALPRAVSMNVINPLVDRTELTAFSTKLYAAWSLFCRAIPSLLVFGTPVLLAALSIPFPQEIFIVVTLVSSCLVFCNGVYMAIYVVTSLLRLRAALNVTEEISQTPNDNGVVHWIIFPQYKEEVETVVMALEAIGKSRIAADSICVMLAMEQREQGADVKAETLITMNKHRFKHMTASWHPAGLPNHPPGKASNVTWAFMELEELIASGSVPVGTKGTLLTVADADTQFHPEYFEALGYAYSACDQEERHLRIWQSPVLHIKNYHRQPMLIVVGTIFTGMQDLATLSDPNAVRFPYSSYSLSIELARRVGGWDPEWIAEDWHMGIKCFIMTVGRCTVQPLMLPTCNYTPEDNTWLKTVDARWSQAKRHALGFSDLSYYFMTLPLLCVKIMDQNEKHVHNGHNSSMRQFWAMYVYGLAVVVRLVNVHVILGLMTFFGLVQFLIKLLMFCFLPATRHVGLLFLRTYPLLGTFATAWVASVVVVTLLFSWMYQLTKDRMDGEPFRHVAIQWLHSMVCFLIFGPFYFLGLGVAVWKAAISVLQTQTFEYEVAAKPTANNHL